MKEMSFAELKEEVDRLQVQLSEATDTLHAISSGQIDALIVSDQGGRSVFTLKSADRAYRLFIEQMTEGAVTLNQEGLIVYCNSQFARLVHRTLPKVMGNLFADFVVAEDVPLFDELLAKSWCTNVKSDMRLKADGKIIDVHLSLNVLEMDDNTSLSVIVTDLTQQKEIERELTAKNQQLRKLNEALTASNYDLQQFASVASHDLQEPLRKIQVFSKFLRDDGFERLSPAAQNYVDKIFKASHRMKVLIVDILTYSKLSADDSLTETVDLSEVVKEILEDFDLRIVEKKARVQVSDLCEVKGNKGQLRQVFHNLISNALKFVATDRAPVIDIRLKPLDPAPPGVSLGSHSQYCCVNVNDNGIGFEDAYSSSIFSLFETLNPKNTYEGSGIGLAIAKKIVNKHHGIIFAKSTPGEGSEFSVILPLNQP